MKVHDKEEVLKTFRGKDTYVTPNNFVFCKKCSSMLLDPADVWQMVVERCMRWQQQKVWKKHWLHISAFKVVCRDCGHPNFIAIVFLRYNIQNPRMKWVVIQFDTEQQLRAFLENQRKKYENSRTST